MASGSGAIPTFPSAPTSSSSDPYADGLRTAIAETERLVATAQATATAAPDNAAARDLARILAESLKSTRKRLTEHLAAPSPRSSSTPLSSAPSHSDLLADWHVANARACQVILARLPPTLLPQCSHIRYAKDLLGYLTERFQSQTPINVIALLRELTSLHLADFTTMADYIARVHTLSSQLAAQKFELSDHVCGALLLTGLTPEYSVHVTLGKMGLPTKDSPNVHNAARMCAIVRNWLRTAILQWAGQDGGPVWVAEEEAWRYSPGKHFHVFIKYPPLDEVRNLTVEIVGDEKEDNDFADGDTSLDGEEDEDEDEEL
ncbi:unnamed protein product [Closterium sp. Yama58-4]|nr:unnamed protein product [Closterium sp. Yama58-4]